MASRYRVFFPHLRDMTFRESRGHSEKGGPESAMNQGYLCFDQPAYENIA